MGESQCGEDPEQADGSAERPRRRPAEWLYRAVDRVFGIDLRSLALFRIGLAILILADLWERSPDIRAFYSDDGVIPRAALIAHLPGMPGPHLSVYMLNGSTAAATAWIVLTALWTIALLIGYRTTVATAVTWYLLLALHWRDPFINNSADDLTRFMLFWSIFLPLGARFSLDARTGHGPTGAASEQKRCLSVASTALLLQVGFMYWFAVASKTDPSWRVDGMAIYYALNIDFYATPFGQFFLNFPQLLYYATFGTLYLEAIGPTVAFVLPFPAVRTTIAVAFFLFHLVFLNLCLDLGAFHYVSAACWIPFLPSELWDGLAQRLRARRRSGKKRLPPASAAATSLASASSVAEREWVLAAMRSDGEPERPSLPWSGHRRGARWVGGAVVQSFVGFYLVFTFVWLLRGVDPILSVRVLPHRYDLIAEVPHMDQGWAMFAPKPFTDNGWYVFPATLADGRTFNLYWGDAGLGQPVHWEKPPVLLSRTFNDERWRRYIMNLWGQAFIDQRSNYARYLCRQWNRTHPAAQQLTALSLYYMLQVTYDNYEQGPVQKVLMLDWRCAPTGGTARTTTEPWNDRGGTHGVWGDGREHVPD